MEGGGKPRILDLVLGTSNCRTAWFSLALSGRRTALVAMSGLLPGTSPVLAVNEPVKTSDRLSFPRKEASVGSFARKPWVFTARGALAEPSQRLVVAGQSLIVPYSYQVKPPFPPLIVT